MSKNMEIGDGEKNHPFFKDDFSLRSQFPKKIKKFTKLLQFQEKRGIIIMQINN